MAESLPPPNQTDASGGGLEISPTTHPDEPKPFVADQQGRPAGRSLRWLLGAIVVLGLLGWGFTATAKPVTVLVEEQPFEIATHQRQVAAVLGELQIELAPEDIVVPAPESPLAAGDTLRIDLARPVIINADGQQIRLLTHQLQPDLILQEAGVPLQPRDEITVDGVLVSPAAGLPPPEVTEPESGPERLLTATTPREFARHRRAVPVELAVYRAIPVTLHDEGARSTFFTARQTVGAALAEHNVTLLPEDRVMPALETRLTPGMRVFIERATPVIIQTDGQMFEARTHRETVGQVLAEQGVALMGQDFSRPALDTPIAPNELIEIVRVRESAEFQEEYIPFETEWVADDEMELDQRQVQQNGATGIIRARTRVRYENGVEVLREPEDEWLAQAPANQVIAYGTRVVVRSLDTPDGPLEYWRRIPMRATAYSAATSGKDADHPLYGVTSSGMQAGFGIVAVDPKVIPLRTELYVDKYGQAVAGDTGGRILGRHIDLGFADNEPLPVIFEWRDVYLLTPIPPADQIRYVLPNWPQQ
jgi:uncharacterized protein YabE (DUF348 family)/3D (Asp-Asp-Asp) domain-containing protein